MDTASPLHIVRKTGSGQFLNVAKAPTPEFIDADPQAPNAFNVNMVEVPIEQAVDALLRETLGLSYLISPGTSGTVTIRTASPLSRAALFDAFQTALEMNGFSVRRENDAYIISGQGGSMRRFLVGAQSVGAANGVHVVPLEYIAAGEMQQILQPIAADALQISPNIDRNILLISGSRESVSAALDAVKLFDVNVMKGKSVSRVELTSANPTAVAAELSVIFDNGPGGALYGVIDFIPNNVLGSILIISSNPQYARDAETWIQGYENAVRTEIYELRNRSASDLANVLTALAAKDASGTAAPVASEGPTGPLSPGAATPVVQGAGVTIVADETANAIIVHATSSKQREISTLIKRLDDVADQVLIEAMIAEVQLNDSLNFGVRHFFESGNFTTSFSGLVSGGAASLFPGANALFDDGGTLTAAIDALSSITEVNIISAPSLLVLDNREALLNIGDQVPVITQSSSSVTDPNAPIVNAVEYRDTGVILRVKPRVDNSGRVILDISQEVSDAVTTDTSEIDAPTIQQRTIATTVAMDDGQSLMLGGLIRQNDINTRAKVPVLGDIPLLGAPFRRTETSNRRTELLVIITPRVVRNPEQARSITEEYKRRLFAPNTLMQRQHHDAGSTLKRIIE
ncbi:MAG: type II secretion system secretin GspD [Pseudomonadota bacterium]